MQERTDMMVVPMAVLIYSAGLQYVDPVTEKNTVDRHDAQASIGQDLPNPAEKQTDPETKKETSK